MPTWRATGLKDRLLHLHDAFWDHRLGVATFGYHPSRGAKDDPRLQVHYTPTPYGHFFGILRHVGLGPDDTVVDLGCGLGRTVFAAAWAGARRAVGVEIEPTLVAAARRNHAASRLAGRDIEFVDAPAERYAHDDTTVLFMFHPFGRDTMVDVRTRLEDALARRPRRLRVAYLNPVHASVLDTSPRLVRSDHWPPRRHGSRNARYAVAFWRTAD